MNKGTIQITSTRKGFAGTLHYTNPKGQEKSIPIMGVKFLGDQYQGECQYEHDNGKLIKLIAHDGTVLLDIKPAATSPVLVSTSGSSRKRLPAPKMVATDDIFDIKQTYLPKEFQDEALRRLDIDNFSLKLNKAAYYEGEGSKLKFWFYKQNRREKHKFIHPNFGSLPFDKIASRHLANAKQLFPNEENLITAQFYPDWRMVVGLGGESVYETSMTLHHVYGIPYIPASTIKGVVRSWIITNIFLPQIPEKVEKRGEKAEEKALKDDVFKKWFGDQDSAGKLTFFDAFPLSQPHISPDVMNPHYQDYYSDGKGQKGPTDYQRTNPISFLTVSGCMFQFLIGTDESDLLKSEMKDDDNSIGDWLQSALQNHGLGAKTAVGYGYMQPSE